MHKIKAIAFDIDNTLYPTAEFIKLARSSAITAMIAAGLKKDRKKVEEKLSKIIRKHSSNFPHHYDILLKEFRIKERERNKLIAHAVHAQHNAKLILQPYPDVPATLVRLRDEGFRLYAASDGFAVKQNEKLIRTGLFYKFHDIFITQDLKCPKNEDFFRKIIKLTGISAENFAMVGDRLDSDIKPAKKVGMHTIRILRGPYAAMGDDEGVGILADIELDDFTSLVEKLKGLCYAVK